MVWEVVDTSGGCGASFAIEIVSEQFEGKRLLERHRMVNAALDEEMKQIHALSIKKAVTPEQWKQQQESAKSDAAAA
ncbi:protein BOLA2 isoform X2 [Prosopis cineraria]|uniref:protein BOLA2 isoform X2 n=1 Tax=Prosopis cineraria TaxID=364024 RepID=UPI002410A431|nr:protein BOLA2 isoform X2 [Prosopis cineraria]